jgi:hypothetical protein
MDGSGEVVVLRCAAPNGARLPAKNVATNMALLTELAWGVQCVSPIDV